eukprot:3070010-Lingulodinium_polyedra.AAC.1
MGMPAPLLRLLVGLHRDCFAHLVFAGKRWPGFFLRAGAKQGDPLAAFIWVLCFDPFLRACGVALPDPRQLVRGMADDVAMVFAHLFRDIKKVWPIFKMLRNVASLHVNKKKTQ